MLLVLTFTLWPFIQEARKNGAKLVSIDPVRTRTAKQSDWHLPIRPGTDGALALGMMHVIIEEQLTDDDYIEKIYHWLCRTEANGYEIIHQKRLPVLRAFQQKILLLLPGNLLRLNLQ